MGKWSVNKLQHWLYNAYAAHAQELPASCVGNLRFLQADVLVIPDRVDMGANLQYPECSTCLRSSLRPDHCSPIPHLTEYPPLENVDEWQIHLFSTALPYLTSPTATIPCTCTPQHDLPWPASNDTCDIVPLTIYLTLQPIPLHHYNHHRQHAATPQPLTPTESEFVSTFKHTNPGLYMITKANISDDECPMVMSAFLRELLEDVGVTSGSCRRNGS
ncbi:hypothetical protein BDQ17DRAFT_1377623 [Cyathus striatus]|nr:hypothetical protein BDQ17DRAFT_1377623 [Cyathus striatus]